MALCTVEEIYDRQTRTARVRVSVDLALVGGVPLVTGVMLVLARLLRLFR